MKRFKTILYVGVGIAIIMLIGYLYSVFFKPTYGGNSNVLGILFFGLLLGGVIAFLIFKLMASKKTTTSVETRHTVVESMRKVFKIVSAEGQFQEIYDYQKTKKLLRFIPSTKKALVIVRAKVLIGYDFEKCKWEMSEEDRKIRIVSFPEPEILSVEPHFKYYYFEEDLFNFINREDLQQIQDEGKKQVVKAALDSGLMQIASEQMRTILTEMVKANHWEIENPEKIALPPKLEQKPLDEDE